MSYQRDRDEFLAILTQELPDLDAGHVAEVARNLCMLANTSQRYAVLACNVGLTERQERADAANDARIKALAESVGCGVVLSGDPRGAVVKIIVPSGRTNDWGQTGICVPTRTY